MKLIHVADGRFAKIGDLVTSFRGAPGTISHFVPPHKPSSSGHISVKVSAGAPDSGASYNYVGVWGLEWIDREDRR